MTDREPETKTAARFSAAALTSFGWHLLAFGAVWVNTFVDREDTSCDNTGVFCFTAKESADLLFLAGAVFLVVSLLVSLALAALFSRRMRSAGLAGTLAAVTSAVVVVLSTAAVIVLNAAF